MQAVILLGRLAGMPPSDARMLAVDELDGWLRLAVEIDLQIGRGRYG